MQVSSSTSNSSIRFLIKFISFVVILVAFFMFIGIKYEESAGKNKINVWSKQRFDEFYELEKNSLDMVFLGSSHSYCTFDPENFDTVLGINSYQLGMPLQHPDGSYYTLLEVLNYQQPKTVVMELYWDVLDQDVEAKQVETLFQVLTNDTLKKEFIKNVFPPNEKAKYYLKPIRFQQDFLAYENKELLDFITKRFGLSRTIVQNIGEEYYRSKGYIYCDYMMSNEALEKAEKENTTDFSRWEFSNVQKKYINKIIQLCKEEKIELIFVTAPISNASFRHMKNYDQIHDQVALLAKENQIKYLDFNLINEEEGLFADEHFRDKGHLNDSGVKIANQYFIEWLENR